MLHEFYQQAKRMATILKNQKCSEIEHIVEFESGEIYKVHFKKLKRLPRDNLT